MQENARISVLEANYKNLIRRWDDHERLDEDRFNRTFNYIEKRGDEIIERIGNLDDKFTEKFADLQLKVDPLWDEKNERKGAMKLSGLIAHSFTALVSIVAALGIKKFW